MTQHIVALFIGLIVWLGLPSAARGGNQEVTVSETSVPFDHHILVDQFGYRTADSKIAVVRNPRRGFDADDRFKPGRRYELRRRSDGKALLAGTPVAWNDARVQESSGDQGWWFDFSAVQIPGEYFVLDTDRGVRSAFFRIADDVYEPVLKAALRTFFYQRSAFRKQPRHAGQCWADEPAYMGPRQESDARAVTDKHGDTSARDLSGGWFDAGDTNKYVTFAAPAVHQLLTAYQRNASAFDDNLGIPESGNGLPDLIDELRYEMAWLARMQNANGSVLLKVGSITDDIASPPSTDQSPRYYVPACTSATIAASGMYAHAALVFSQFPSLRKDVDELRRRAVSSWENFSNAPRLETECDSGEVRAGDADLSEQRQIGLAVVAAIYLAALTTDQTYTRYVAKNYTQTRPFRDVGWSRYDPEEGEALLFHAAQGTTDVSISNAIRDAKKADINGGYGVYRLVEHEDLYRAHLHDIQYHWGSNGVRANYGNTNLDAIHVVTGDTKPYADRALGVLHYFHGVNPFAMVYLSNMYSLGATKSANAIYHTWFKSGTRWADALKSECGPPPGYLPGGPNVYAEQNGVPATIKPPNGQPAQKAYRDWNALWPESSWAVTEPAIYYQAAYVRLLSAFVR